MSFDHKLTVLESNSTFLSGRERNCDKFVIIINYDDEILRRVIKIKKNPGM